MATQISVSVVIPVRNGAALIARALESIATQTLSVDNVVVVDDGSTDGLERVLNAVGYAGMYIRQEQQGQGAALNRGIAACRTSHIAFLDHDDEWVSDKNEWQVAYLREANCDAVFGSVTNVFTSPEGDVREVAMGPARVLGASLVRASVFQEVAPFVSDHRIHEVIDWWSRASVECHVEGVNAPALRRHVHGANQTLKAEHRKRSDLLSRVRDHHRRLAHE